MSWIIPWLVSNTLLAALLGGLAWVVWRTLRSPAAVHALWVAALIKLITPPLWTVPIDGLLPAGQELRAEVLPTVSLGVSDLPQHTGLSSPSDGDLGRVSTPSGSPISLLRGLLLIWGLGSVIYFMTTGARIWRFQRGLLRWRPAPAALQSEVRRIARRLGLPTTPRVVVSQTRTSPAVWAFLGAPKVLLPLPLISRLNRQQRETLLAHELCHIKRGDHWLRLLEWLVKGLLWWNPVAWLVSRGIRESEELCCDALVVATMPDLARSYASALLEAVDFLSVEGRVPLKVGLAPVRLLERRILMIAESTFTLRMPGGVRVLLLVLVLLLLPLSLVTAGPIPQQPAPSSPPAQKEEVEEPLENENWHEVLREAMAQVREAISRARISPQVREALQESREEVKAAMQELRSKRETIREQLRQSLDRDKIRQQIREALENTRELTDEERERIQEKLSELKIDEIVDGSLRTAMTAIESIDVERIIESVMSEIDIESIVESSLKAVEEALSKLEREKKQN